MGHWIGRRHVSFLRPECGTAPWGERYIALHNLVDARVSRCVTLCNSRDVRFASLDRELTHFNNSPSANSLLGKNRQRKVNDGHKTQATKLYVYQQARVVVCNRQHRQPPSCFDGALARRHTSAGQAGDPQNSPSDTTSPCEGRPRLTVCSGLEIRP